mmetsp:Transcript_24692/g.80951  ORF Transcript_24692/g.80951 Transcript_24692/m.80951 type:complete len:234 (+) Transcript_24692:204-905(+)
MFSSRRCCSVCSSWIFSILSCSSFSICFNFSRSTCRLSRASRIRILSRSASMNDSSFSRASSSILRMFCWRLSLSALRRCRVICSCKALVCISYDHESCRFLMFASRLFSSSMNLSYFSCRRHPSISSCFSISRSASLRSLAVRMKAMSASSRCRCSSCCCIHVLSIFAMFSLLLLSRSSDLAFASASASSRRLLSSSRLRMFASRLAASISLRCASCFSLSGSMSPTRDAMA